MTQPVPFPHQPGSNQPQLASTQPTPAFIGASWTALLTGVSAFLAGMYNANLELNEKGYYFTVLCYGLFSAVSLQKSVRDRLEGIAVTNLYFGLCWISVGAVLTLLGAGLWNTTGLSLSEKGFYGMAFALSLFAAVAVQKNVRDMNLMSETTEQAAPEPLRGY